jgi:hypothetical protein
MAWAAGKIDAWWWPDAGGDYYWPAGVPRQETHAAFVLAYQQIGYEVCASAELEAGFEKIALYLDAAGVPAHAARQLPSGAWTSKLGSWEDIEHPTLDALAGRDAGYGSPNVILRRPQGVNRRQTSDAIVL